MNSLTDLRGAVDVVIGVDTHIHTHSAAVVNAATGGVLDEITVEASPEGYAELWRASPSVRLRYGRWPCAGPSAGGSSWRWSPTRGSVACATR